MTEQALKGRRKSRRKPKNYEHVHDPGAVSRSGPEPKIIEVSITFDLRRSNKSVGDLMHELIRLGGRQYGAVCCNLSVSGHSYDWRQPSIINVDFPLIGEPIPPKRKPTPRRKSRETAVL